MNTTKLILAAAALSAQLVLAQPVLADNAKWKRVSESEDGKNRHYVDTNSIRRSGDTVEFTERTELKGDPDGWREMRSESRINCKTGMSLPVRLTITYADGKTELFENADPESWTAIEPDSVGSEIEQFVCQK